MAQVVMGAGASGAKQRGNQGNQSYAAITRPAHRKRALIKVNQINRVSAENTDNYQEYEPKPREYGYVQVRFSAAGLALASRIPIIQGMKHANYYRACFYPVFTGFVHDLYDLKFKNCQSWADSSDDAASDQLNDEFTAIVKHCQDEYVTLRQISKGNLDLSIENKEKLNDWMITQFSGMYDTAFYRTTLMIIYNLLNDLIQVPCPTHEENVLHLPNATCNVPMIPARDAEWKMTSKRKCRCHYVVLSF
jgi:hypothetical protein